MNRYVALLIGIAIVMIGLALVMPAIAQLRDAGALPTVGVGLFLLGLAMMVGGGRTVVYASKRLRA